MSRVVLPPSLDISAVLLRSDEWQVAYLGADTPFVEAIELAHALDGAAICFSAASGGSARAIDHELGRKPPPDSRGILVSGQRTARTDVRDALTQLRGPAA